MRAVRQVRCFVIKPAAERILMLNETWIKTDTTQTGCCWDTCNGEDPIEYPFVTGAVGERIFWAQMAYCAIWGHRPWHFA